MDLLGLALVEDRTERELRMGSFGVQGRFLCVPSLGKPAFYHCTGCAANASVAGPPCRMLTIRGAGQAHKIGSAAPVERAEPWNLRVEPAPRRVSAQSLRRLLYQAQVGVLLDVGRAAHEAE